MPSEKRDEFMEQDQALAPGIALLAKGDALAASGQSAEAEAVYREAVRRDPDNAEAHFKLANALRLLGRLDAALIAIERAISARPDWMEAHISRAATLDLQGHPEQALAAYLEATARWPDAAALETVLGNLLLRMERPAEALSALRRAAARNPASAVIQCHLGLALLELRQSDEAIVALREALRLRPKFPEALVSLAEALRGRGQLDEARQAAEAAIRIDFNQPTAHHHLGNVLCDLGAFAEAANAYRRALGLQPGDPAVMSNLGIALYALGQLPESLAQHRMAVSLRSAAGFRYNFAVALLAAGEFEEGWAAYESRLGLGLASSMSLDVAQPRWTGEALEGRTVLLYGEQGLGDTLQFVRYAPLVAKCDGRVVLEVPAPLVRLFQRMPGVAEVIPTGTPMAEFDLHCPLLSLPHLFGTRLESIPAVVPYLAADPLLVEAWRDRMPQNGKRVGIVWSGNPRADQPSAAFVDRRRSMPLRQFAPFATVPGIRYFSLQKGSPAAQLESAPTGLHIVDLMDEVNDFADTAALLAHLDLVITVDTSVAHLAGALGKPVWMLSRYDACWRWLRDRNDSPWYPTMRIYRQPMPGDWDSVIARVTADLRAWSQQRRKARGARSARAVAAI